MNGQPAQQSQPSTGQDEWDEARIEEAMKRLKLLHVKMRMLRDAVPRIVDPLIKPQPSPDIMYTAIMKAVTEVPAEVKAFTELMREDTSKEVLAHAAKSREEKPYGIRPWKHSEHPDWFTLDDEK